MIGYVVLGTNDLARAASFYDELLAESSHLIDEMQIVAVRPEADLLQATKKPGQCRVLGQIQLAPKIRHRPSA